jgi:hypothetical protein
MQPIASYGEAKVTYFRVKGTQGCGSTPLSHKAYKFIPAVRQKMYLKEP